MRIDQVLVAASPGDAVTNATFALRGLLRRVCPSDIYARFIDPRLSGDVLFLGSYQDRAGGGGSDVLIYHASIGEPEVAAFLLERRERLALVYHNITPPEYFAVLQPGFAQLLAAGRAELSLLRKRVELALAVSSGEVRLDLVLVARVGMDDEPLARAVIGAGLPLDFLLFLALFEGVEQIGVGRQARGLLQAAERVRIEVVAWLVVDGFGDVSGHRQSKRKSTPLAKA
jgi:hypothetical protein